MQILGQFIVELRKELGLAGREVVAQVRNSDGKPISADLVPDINAMALTGAGRAGS